jgi:hypothetical protein
MSTFEINLIRTRVLPPARRKALFWGVVGYLVVCAVVLVLVAHTATREFVSARWKRSDMLRIEREFREAHPTQPDMLTYASVLGNQATSLLDTLGEVDDALARRSHLTLLLRRLSVPLPDEAHLLQFKMDTDERTLEFEIAAPIVSAEGLVPSAAEMVSVWKQDELLMTQLSDIDAVASTRMLVDGRAAYILKFSGELAGQGS